MGKSDGQVGEVTVVLGGDWSPLQSTLAQVNQALNQTGASFSVTGQAIDESITAPMGRAAGAVQQATGSLPNFYQGVEEAGVRAGGAERAVRRLESSLGAVALQSLGAQGGLAGAAARVGEASLLFGYGSEAVLGLGAGFAAFGLTLHLIMGPLEEAQAANEKLNATLIKTAESVSPGMAAVENFSAIVQKFQETSDNLAKDQKLAEFFRIFGNFTGGLTSGIADAFDAAAITEQSNQATERTTGIILADQVRKGQGADISKRGIAEIGIQRAQGNVTGLTQVLNDRLQQIRNLNLSADVTDALDQPLVKAFDDAFLTAMKEAADKGDLGSLTGLLEKGRAAIQAVGLPAGVASEAVDQLNKSYLELAKTLETITPRHLLAPITAPTLKLPTRSQDLFGPTPPTPFGLQNRIDAFGAAPITPIAPLPAPKLNLSAVGSGLPAGFAEEGQRLTEAVQLAPHDVQGEITALEQLAKTHQHLNELLAAGVISQKTYDVALKDAEAQADHTMKTMFDLSGALSSAFTSIADSVGGALAGAKGGLSNFGAALFQIFGNLLKTLGSALIGFGTAGIAIKNFITNPFLAIAAGTALIALGSALGATATSAVSSAGSAVASGGSYGGGASGPIYYNSQDKAVPQPVAGATVVINTRGGIVNLNDPDTMDELQHALETLSGNRVTVQIGKVAGS